MESKAYLTLVATWSFVNVDGNLRFLSEMPARRCRGVETIFLGASCQRLLWSAAGSTYEDVTRTERAAARKEFAAKSSTDMQLGRLRPSWVSRINNVFQ